MIAAYFAMIAFFRKMREGWKDTEFRGLFWSMLAFLLMGTLFYRAIEEWSWIDSFYFTVITLTTVGYGDFSPQTDIGKLFTVIYIIMGLGLLSSFIIKLATINVPRNERKRLRSPLLFGPEAEEEEEEGIETEEKK